MGINELKNFDVAKFMKRREVLINLVVIVAVLFISRAILQNRNRSVVRLKDELKEQSEVNRLSVELEKLDSELAQLRKGIPQEAISTVSVVDKITNLARKRNISISSITPRNPKAKDFYLEFPFEIEISADFRQAGGFLSDIENASDLFRVDLLQISASQEEFSKDSKTHKIRITISAISWKN